MSNKRTDDSYLISVENKKSSFTPEQMKKGLNHLLKISIHLK